MDAGAQTLARQFEQSKRRYAADLNTCPVGLHGLFHAPLDRSVVAVFVHIDEIDNDQTCQVAQAQLARHLVGGLQIGSPGGLFDVAFARRAARVNVDGDQGLGRIDDDVAARAQVHDRVVNLVELLLDAVPVKQGNVVVGVFFDAFDVRGHHRTHECPRRLVGFLAVDDDFFDVAVIDVAQRAFYQVAFFVNHRRRRRLQGLLADIVPSPAQIFVIAADLGLVALNPGRSHDHRHPLGNFEVGHDRLHTLTVGRIGDLAADAAAARGVGH